MLHSHCRKGFSSANENFVIRPTPRWRRLKHKIIEVVIRAAHGFQRFEIKPPSFTLADPTASAT